MKKILFCFFILLATLGNAQNPGDVAQNYGNGSSLGYNSFGAYCNVTTVQSTDGKIIVGGNFTNYYNSTVNKIVRLNTDGTIDTTFNTGLGFNGGIVYDIKLQSDGKIIVVGDFTQYNTTNVKGIVRLNINGSIDSTFSVGTGFNNIVKSIIIQSDDKIIVGGDFTNYNGTVSNRIIRLNSNGTFDNSFNVGTGFDSSVEKISLQNTKLIVGGNFTTYNGVSNNRIIRLNNDGSIDNTYTNGTGCNGTVYAIDVHAGGKIILGGTFTNYNGTTSNKLIRLNNDGTVDTTLNLGTGFDLTVSKITVQSDEKIIVGGDFSIFNGSQTKWFVRLDANGNKDTSFNSLISTNGGVSPIIKSINILPNGKIILTGNSFKINEIDVNGITQLNTNGTIDNTFYKGTGLNNYVNSTAQQSDGKIIVGGDFSLYNGSSANRIVRFNTNGTLDPSFNIGGSGFNGTINKIIIQPDNKIIVMGKFTIYNGSNANSIIRLNSDGSIDTTFNIGTGFNDEVTNGVLQNDGKIIVHTYANNYNGSSLGNRLVRLNTTGTRDTSFTPNFTLFSGNILEKTLDGKILVGGNIIISAVSMERIIRLNSNGSYENGFEISISGILKDVQVNASNGKIITASETRISSFNADGSTDSSFTSYSIGTSGAPQIYKMAIQPDNKIAFVGYNFSRTHGGKTYNNFMRLNPDGSADTTLNTGTGFTLFHKIRTIQLLNDGKFLIGGDFTNYNNSYASSNLIKLESGLAPLATNDFELNNSISVYPNPVKDILNVSSTDNAIVTSLKIYDLQGKLITETANNTVNITNLSTGLYVVKIVTDQGQLNKKFIKE